MAAAVVDIAVLLGMVDADDQHHDVAMEIVRGMDGGTLPTGQITNYVILETLNWIHGRHRHDKAREVYGRLKESGGFEILHAAQKDFTRAVDVFDTYESLSFGDAMIVAYMEREDLKYLYSFDDDFDIVDGLTRLTTADNPFV
jgi:predicted nucleic acid-binding protein